MVHMNFLLKIVKPLLKRRLRKELQDPENKAWVMNKLKEKVDIPKLDAEAEAKLWCQIYDALAEAAQEAAANL